MEIEIKKCGAFGILKNIGDALYICACGVMTYENNETFYHSFIYDKHFKIIGKKWFCVYLIDNRSNASIYVLNDGNIVSRKKLKFALRKF